MAVRIRNRFHDGRERAPAELASVIATLAWKLAIDSIGRMRKAQYDIDIGRPYFEFVSEFLVFLATAADRIAHRELDAEARVAFTTALATRMADIVEDNRDMLLGEAAPDACRHDFLDRFNRRGADYAEFGYGDDGPDFGFRRYFAACLREVLPAKDQLWVVDQAMDIEAPQAVKALEKTLAGIFAADA
ncbi:MAG: hypothetical protein PHY45_05580 [Rhodocyclaceae bacterium]|nr:hypothetical protein [Rhodocyclaceae bacterium]